MRRVAAVLFTVAWALPVVGQRWGVRAVGSAGVRVQGGASRAGLASAGAARVGVGANRVVSGVPASRLRGYGTSDSRRGSFASDRYRPRYGGYGTNVPLILPIWSGWGGWGDTALGYDAAGYGGAVPGVDAGFGVGGAPDDGLAQGPGPYVAPYAGPGYQAAAPVVRPTVAPEPEEAVTLVFRDGRAAEQIHNYALTRTRLMVLDGRPREIPLELLDLVTTERVNREAGVEFKVPVGR